MGDPRIAVALFLPLILGVVTTLVQLTQGRLRLSWRGKRQLELAGLATACMGLVIGLVLIVLAQGEANLPWLGVNLAVSPLSRLGLIGVNVALFVMIVAGAEGEAPLRTASVVLFTAWLLASTLLVTDRLVSVLCLFGSAMAVCLVAAFPVIADKQHRQPDARLLAGGLKHLALATVGTGLLVAGMLMRAHYALNMENLSMLQVGLGLLAVGLAVRVGTMPFAASSADLVEAAPQAAILTLGAVSPAALIMGLLVLTGPGTGVAGLAGLPQAGQQVALGLGAIGAVLAGLRALASGETTPGTRASRLPVLISSSVALQMGWALFGVFSGSRSGALGATLLAVNLSLAVPMLITSKEKIGWAVGAGALLGLPPSGGFVGTLLVAQAAVAVNGAWLAVLLAGSVGVAAAWLRAIGWLGIGTQLEEPGKNWTLARLLCWALIVAQAVWFVVSFFVVI